MTEKRMTTERRRINLDYANINEAIHILQEIKMESGPKAHITIESYDEYGSPVAEINVEWKRPETEVEKEKRIKQEEYRAMYSLVQEQAQYLKLKAKFGD